MLSIVVLSFRTTIHVPSPKLQENYFVLQYKHTMVIAKGSLFANESKTFLFSKLSIGWFFFQFHLLITFCVIVHLLNE